MLQPKTLYFPLNLQVLFVSCDDGVILLRELTEADWNNKQHFCIYFNPLFHNLSTTIAGSTSYQLTDLTDRFGCQSSDYKGEIIEGNAVLVARGNCTFSAKARMAQEFGAEALIISSDELLTPGAENASVDYNEINITVATLLKSDFDRTDLSKGSIEVLMYAPEINGRFDPCMIVIFLIAVTNIAIGGFWAGHVKHAKYQTLKNKRSSKSLDEEQTDNKESDNDKEDNESVDITLPAILIFFVLVCGFLVLLYFFYDQLVYVVIAMFCLAGSMGLYHCVYPFWKRVVCCSAKIPRNKLPFLRSRPEYRNIILALMCLGVGIFWGVMRHAPYAWVIQDILGYTFCLNIMKTVGVPNLKVCTVMLTLLFLYDIFFVFITPLFTKGESVMVKVATGSGSKTNEQLPMVFKVPKLTSDIINVCPLPYSLLGFGDIIIPGLLVAHNYAFDLFIGSKKIYYLSTVVAYGVGLIITFVALLFMETGQPALLYLVPCTLVTTFLVGCIRGEINYLWAGMNQSAKEESTPDPQKSQSEVSVNSNASDSSDANENGTLIKK